MNYPIEREWAMPSSDTFSIPPITRLLDHWLKDRPVVIDPFARNSTRGTITNDLSPATTAHYHLLAEEFAEKMVDQGIVADALLFDPPYSPRQISECYRAAGLTATMRDTQNARLKKCVKTSLTRTLRQGGVAISFGWNSCGFGKALGFEPVYMLLVAHGSAHNDTIVVVERKL